MKFDTPHDLITSPLPLEVLEATLEAGGWMSRVHRVIEEVTCGHEGVVGVKGGSHGVIRLIQKFSKIFRGPTDRLTDRPTKKTNRLTYTIR